MPRPAPAAIAQAQEVAATGSFKDIIEAPLTVDDFLSSKALMTLFMVLDSLKATNIPSKEDFEELEELHDTLCYVDGDDDGGEAVADDAAADGNNNDAAGAGGAGAAPQRGARAQGVAGAARGRGLNPQAVGRAPPAAPVIPDIDWAAGHLGDAVASFTSAVMELACVVHWSSRAKFEGWAASHGLDRGAGKQFADLVRRACIPEDAIVLVRTPWVTQRLTEQSTTTLTKAAYLSLGAAAPRFFGVADPSWLTLEAQFARQHDVPTIVVAKVYVYLAAVSYPVGDWYQGKAALQAMAGPLMVRFKAYLTGYLSRISNSDLIELAKSAGAIADAYAAGSDDAILNEVRVASVRISILNILREAGFQVANGHVLTPAQVVEMGAAAGAPRDIVERIRALAATVEDDEE